MPTFWKKIKTHLRFETYVFFNWRRRDGVWASFQGISSLSGKQTYEHYGQNGNEWEEKINKTTTLIFCLEKQPWAGGWVTEHDLYGNSSKICTSSCLIWLKKWITSNLLCILIQWFEKFLQNSEVAGVRTSGGLSCCNCASDCKVPDSVVVGKHSCYLYTKNYSGIHQQLHLFCCKRGGQLITGTNTLLKSF